MTTSHTYQHSGANGGLECKSCDHEWRVRTALVSAGSRGLDVDVRGPSETPVARPEAPHDVCLHVWPRMRRLGAARGARERARKRRGSTARRVPEAERGSRAHLRQDARASDMDTPLGGVLGTGVEARCIASDAGRGHIQVSREVASEALCTERIECTVARVRVHGTCVQRLVVIRSCMHRV